MLMHNQLPYELPIRMVLMWAEMLEDHLEAEVELRRVATEKALGNFWSELS